MVAVRLCEHADDQVEVLLQALPHGVRLRGQHRAALVVGQVEHRLPEQPGAAAINQNAVLDALACRGAGAQQFVELGPHIPVRRHAVDHPAQRQVDVPAHHGAPVHFPQEARVCGQSGEADFHPAHHDAEIEPLQHRTQVVGRPAPFRGMALGHVQDSRAALT